MAYPSKPVKQTSYTAHEQQQGNGWLPGQAMDVDLLNYKASIDRVIDFLTVIARSDGALANGIVGLDQLAPDVRLLFGLTGVPDDSGTITVTVPGQYLTLQAAFEATRGLPVLGVNQIVVHIEANHALTAGVLLDGGDWSRHVITADDATVFLSEDFVGVSNDILEEYGENLGAAFASEENLFVGRNCSMPRLACLIDMASPRGAGRLGNGVILQSCDMVVEWGAGVINAGICGLSAQVSQITALGSIWNGAGGECVRIQQCGNASFQSGFGEGGQADTGLWATTSGASVFVSRGSSSHFTLFSGKDSLNNGLETHRAFVSATEADFSGAALDCGRFLIGSHVIAKNSDFSGAGRNAVRVEDFSHVSLVNTDLSGCATFSLVLDSGGGVVSIEDATTKTGAPNVPEFADVDGIAAFNYPTITGCVFSSEPGPLQDFNIRGCLAFSSTGVTDGKTFASSVGILDSSRDAASSQKHYRIYNDNGEVGSISSSGSGTAFTTTSDGQLKADPTPADAEAALERVLSWQVKDFEWLKAGDGTPTGVMGRGMIAQEQILISPEMVSEGVGAPGDSAYEPWGVDYSKAVPDLVLAIQALKAKGLF